MVHPELGTIPKHKQDLKYIYRCAEFLLKAFYDTVIELKVSLRTHCRKKTSLIKEYKIIIHMSQNELNMFFFIEPHFHPVFPTVFFSFDAYKEEQSGFINYSAKFSSFRAGLVESNTFKARMNKHNFKVHREE